MALKPSTMLFQDGVGLKSLEELQNLTLEEKLVKKRCSDLPTNEERLLLWSGDEDEDTPITDSSDLDKFLNESPDGSGSNGVFAQKKVRRLVGSSGSDEGFKSDETLNGLSVFPNGNDKGKQQNDWFICRSLDNAFAIGGSNPELRPTSLPSLSDQEKKRRRAERFGFTGSISSFLNPEGKSGHSSTTNSFNKIKIETMKTEDMEGVDEDICSGKIRSSKRVELSDPEKKRLRATRFSFSRKVDAVSTPRGMSAIAAAERVPMKIENKEIHREVEASKEKIGALVDAVLEDLEAYYTKQRSQLLQSNGLVSTPLHALKEYAEFTRDTMHQEITCLPIAGRFKPLIRTEFIVGRFRGVGEAYDRRASGQMAALDILMKMKMKESRVRVAPFGLLPGWRISPRVFNDLNKFCTLNGLQKPHFATKSNIDDKEKPVFGVQCFMGSNLVAQVDTDVLYYGRKKAASLALEKLSGDKYPREYLTFGAACLSYKDLIKIGLKPVMSSQKRIWMLQQFKEHGETVNQYGVDKDELHGLQAHLKELEIQGESYNGMKRRIQITIPNDNGDGMPARKLIKLIE